MLPIVKCPMMIMTSPLRWRIIAFMITALTIPFLTQMMRPSISFICTTKVILSLWPSSYILGSEYDEDDYGDVGFPLFAPAYLLDAGDDEDDEDEEDEYYSDGFDGYAFPEELDRFTQMFDFIHQLMSRRNNILGNYIPDDEFDDSYEALLRLSERIGEVKQRGFNQMQVDSLPTKLYQPELSPTPTQKEETSCPICLEAFLPNCKLMYFECGHQFHSECSKRWLRQRSTCPVCRIEMPPPVIDLREDD